MTSNSQTADESCWIHPTQAIRNRQNNPETHPFPQKLKLQQLCPNNLQIQSGLRRAEIKQKNREAVGERARDKGTNLFPVTGRLLEGAWKELPPLSRSFTDLLASASTLSAYIVDSARGNILLINLKKP